MGNCFTIPEKENTSMADHMVSSVLGDGVEAEASSSHQHEPEPEPEPVPVPVPVPVHMPVPVPMPIPIPEHQPYRTGYHFQPTRNWMNDPNGPMIHNGIYHLFYQYNPEGPVWGNITWAHSTSTDLINWDHREHALLPSDPFDIKGCWSGSATIRPGGKPAILYTGGESLTNGGGSQVDDSRQVQILAVPKDLSDPFLIEWIKPPQNPVMVPPNGVPANCFRDPSTAWQGPDGRWRVIVGGAIDRQGLAILYTSDDDFVHWTESDHPLHSANCGMWECLDFFPVSLNSNDGVDTSVNHDGVKHVFKFSLCDNIKDYYTIGTYNQAEDRYIPDPGCIEDHTGLGIDYGRYYASKSFFDSARNRRILTSWVNEACSREQDIQKGWSGLQAIPRSLWLDKTGKSLIQWPVDELERLRTGRVDLPSTNLKGGSVLRISGVTASQADVEVSFELAELEKAELWDPSWPVDPQVLCTQKDASKEGVFGPFGLLVLASEMLEEETTTRIEKIKEQTAIFFRIFKDQNKYKVVMGSDQSRSRSEEQEGLDKTSYGAFLEVDPLHEKISLRTLIDHSIVESFGGEGKTCMTARVYPKLAIDDKAHLYVFNYGTENVKISSLSAWSMNSAVIN